MLSRDVKHTATEPFGLSFCSVVHTKPSAIFEHSGSFFNRGVGHLNDNEWFGVPIGMSHAVPENDGRNAPCRRQWNSAALD